MEIFQKYKFKKRFTLYSFDKTIKIGEDLRKDIIVDIDELKKLIEEKIYFNLILDYILLR